MRLLRCACFLLFAVLLSTGCGGAAIPSIELTGKDEQAAVVLHEHFVGIHDHEVEISDELKARIDESLALLARQLEPSPALTVTLINNPDADAGCIAGGRLYISLGMLSFLEHPDELTGLVALALTGCGQASEQWRRRASLGLPEIDEKNPLMHLYRDFRLEAQAPLYRQLVLSGCGGRQVCVDRASEWLRSAGATDAGLYRLLGRVRESWPDAAVYYRVGPVSSPARPAPDAEPAFSALILPLGELREALGHLRETRSETMFGDVGAAYRAAIRAGDAKPDFWLLPLYRARLHLANVHPESAIRELGDARGFYTDPPAVDLFFGIALWHQTRAGAAMERLIESLQGRETVSGHYYLGRVYTAQQKPDQALKHLRIAEQAGDVHPYGADAARRRVRVSQ